VERELEGPGMTWARAKELANHRDRCESVRRGPMLPLGAQGNKSSQNIGYGQMNHVYLM
jgi:hypothetical protein